MSVIIVRNCENFCYPIPFLWEILGKKKEEGIFITSQKSIYIFKKLTN